MISKQPWSLHRRTLLTGLVGLGAAAVIGGNKALAAVEQNTLKRRGVGLIARDPEGASPGFTLFAPHFVENRTVYLVDLQGRVHTWNMPYPPGLSGYLTERGTLFYNGRTPEESFLSRFPFKGGVVLGSGLERQDALGITPSGPPSSRHSVAQWKCAAALHGRGARRNCPPRPRRNGGEQYAIGPIRCSTRG
jgi:hypothetical protein